MRKKIVAGILLLALIASIFTGTAAADSETASTAAVAASTSAYKTGDVVTVDATADQETNYTTTQVSSSFQLVASNDSLELYVNPNLGILGVKDLTSGFIWYSSVPGDTYARDGFTDSQNYTLDSLFVLDYTVLNTNDNNLASVPINSLNPEITVTKIEDGCELRYYLDDLCLEIVVEVVLDGDALQVTIPQEKIIEGKNTDAKLQELKDEVQEFINTCTADIDEVEQADISKNRGNIRKSRKRLEDLQSTLDSIESLSGVSAYQSEASIILQDYLQKFLFGGATTGDSVGVFPRAYRTKTVSQADRSKYEQMATKLQSQLLSCAQSFAKMNTIQMGGIVAIKLLSNFGAAADTENGYVFYPDGSGALTYNKVEHSSASEEYSADIYSDRTVNVAWEYNRDATGLKRTMLPVYGTKKDNNAFVAMITDGDTNAAICLEPSGNVFNLNRINAKFTYRNTVNITSNSQYSTGSQSTIYEKIATPISPSIRYQFLNGTNYSADYSGMASAYREYLLETGELQTSQLLSDDMPLALDFVAGTWKSMLFYESYVPLSTFDQMSSVVDDMNNAGISDIFLYVEAWDKSEAPSTIKFPRKTGGVEAFQSLTEKVQAGGGNTFLGVELVMADTYSNNISMSNLAYDTDLTVYQNNTFWDRLFSPRYIQNQFSKTTQKLSKLGNMGVGLNQMASLIYSDYNTAYNTNRDDCAQVWSDLYAQLQAQGTQTVAFGGNKYLLGNVDWLMDIPMDSTGYTFSDASVPFYQMVVHGSIPYSAKPFNNFYSKTTERLRSIEYGCIPLYKLTYEDTSDLGDLYTEFTSQYTETLRDEIIQAYEEFKETLAPLNTAYIVHHEKLTDDLSEVTYSNGTRIYINYADQDCTLESGKVVPAQDYLVLN